jgi:hypothetical protein
MVTPIPAANEMAGALRVLDHELAFVVQDQTELKEVVADRRAHLEEIEQEITVVRKQIARLREENILTRTYLEERNSGARIGGMIQMFLRVAGTVANEERTSPEMEAAALSEAIGVLEEETDFSSFKARTATFLGGVGQTITRWARELSLAYADGLLTFDIRGRQLVSETDGGSIPFSRFGSGKNWVWYHLLGHMALRQWFSERKRPTPRFLVLDQPSQVYFPAGHIEEGQTDLDEVRGIYDWLNKKTADFDGDMQIIVTDHARFPDDTAFAAHIVLDWWNEDGALIPASWLTGH